MKRLFCIIGSLLICTSSVFAWNAESFLSDGSAEYQPYELDPVEDPAPVLVPDERPMLFSARPSTFASGDSSASSVRLSELVMQSGVPVGNAGNAYVRGWYTSEGGSYPGIEIPDIFTFDEFFAGSFSPFYDDYGNVILVTGECNLPYKTDDNEEYEGFDYPYFLNFPQSGSTSLTIEVDVSSYNATAVEFFGNPGFYYTAYSLSLAESVYASSGYAVYVDGNYCGLFNGDMGGYLYQSSNVIQKIRFELVNPGALKLDPDRYILSTYFWVDGLNLSFLSDNLILDGFNDQAQDDINEHHSIESEWTGSMTENFNSLDLSGFTFPGGLVAAFALITGIFNDLWNGMGDYKILYVFPLTLGVVLLLIGRISKFSGRSSSGRGGKGDDSA